jgi:hypothetical protein
LIVPIALVVPIVYCESGKETEEPSQIRIRLAGAIAVTAKAFIESTAREATRIILRKFMKYSKSLKKMTGIVF